MFKQIGSIFSFLTILPTSNATLDDIAKYMYLFPIVGILIGILVGSFDVGKIVKKEKIEPICLNIKPPSNKR